MIDKADSLSNIEMRDQSLLIPALCAGILGLSHAFLATTVGVLAEAMTLAIAMTLASAMVLADATVWATSIALCAGLLRWLVPKQCAWWLGVITLVNIAISIGMLEVATVMIWLFSAWSLGALVIRWLFDSDIERVSPAVSLVLGSSLWLAVWGAMLHFPVNDRSLHIALTLLPLIMMLRYLRILLPRALHASVLLRGWTRSVRFEVWTVGLIVAGWVLRWASFPSVGYDDHALHLRMWTELFNLSRYSFDINSQIWSVAPFALDLLHAGISLMAGADVRGALNLGLALLMFLVMARLMHGWAISPTVNWSLISLMASTPLLGSLLLTLHTELALSVFLLSGVYLATHPDVKLYSQQAWGVFACAALAAASKLTGLLLGAAVGAVFLTMCFLHRPLTRSHEILLPWRALAILSVLAFLAFHSYGLAWHLTGNPVFPLYNAIFASPFFPLENFRDGRWIHGFSLNNFVTAFFKTSLFIESKDYTAGWQYLFLAPLACLATIRRDVPLSAKLLLLPTVGFFLVMFYMTQYWRYLFPIMPVAGALIGVLFIRVSRSVVGLVLTVAACAMFGNLFAFTGISWLMSKPVSLATTDSDKSALIAQYAPVADLSDRVSAIAPGARVLYPYEAPYGARLDGTPIYVNWYAPARARRFYSVRSVSGMRSYLAQEQIDFVILGAVDPQVEITAAQLLREHLALYGMAVAQQGGYTLYRIGDAELGYRAAFRLEGLETHHRAQDGLMATPTPRPLANFSSERAQQARYSVRFECFSPLDSFIAQINWDKGEPYYRLVSCRAGNIRFSEAIPIPIGAKRGTVYISVRGDSTAKVNALEIDLY